MLEYNHRGHRYRAVEGVGFSLAKNEILGVVGESGSGKSTITKATLGLLPVTSGNLRVQGLNLARLRGRAAKAATPRSG